VKSNLVSGFFRSLLGAAMSTVGIKELKNRLTHYLRQAKMGEEIVVTERDRPIALIHRIDSAREPASIEARLAKAASEGWLTLPRGSQKRARIRKVKVRGASAAKTISEDREDRF
jgi:prevent-host-death family protein